MAAGFFAAGFFAFLTAFLGLAFFAALVAFRPPKMASQPAAYFSVEPTRMTDICVALSKKQNPASSAANRCADHDDLLSSSGQPKIEVGCHDG